MITGMLRAAGNLLSDYSLRGALAVTALFSLVNALVRRAAGTSLTMDDSKTNVFTQIWQGGYQPDNPPLFEWLLILIHPFTGGGLASFLLIKYASLMVAAGFLYAVVRKAADQRTAYVVTLGVVLLYQIGWNFHQAFTHSALLVPAIAAGIWAVLTAIERPGVRSAIILGVIVGISLLTKYNAALFWGGVIIAVGSVAEARRALVKPAFLVTPLIAALIVLPHGLWFVSQTGAYTASIEATLGLDHSNHFVRAMEGGGSLVVSTLMFFIPFGFVSGWLWYRRRPEWHSIDLLLMRISVGAWALLAAAVVIFGISNVSERYLIPVLLPAYVGLAMAQLRARSDAQGLVLRASLFIAALVIVMRIASILFPGEPFCSSCRDFIPYKALKKPIAEMIEPGAILIVREENTGGNLVKMFPASPVRVFTSVHLTNPITDDGLPCYLVWSKDMIDPDLPLEPPIMYMEIDPKTVMIDAAWTHPLKPQDWRRTKWGVTPILKDSLYKTFCTSKR